MFTKSRSVNPGLGKALLQHAPFLRMYADYVRNFDQAMELMRTWTERSSAFRNIIQDIQVRHTDQNISCMYLPVTSDPDVMHALLESGRVWQPHPAAPHVGASPEGPTL